MSKHMNTREAMQALLDGKNIRKIIWARDSFIFLDHRNKIMGHNHNEWNFNIDAVYELYEEKEEYFQWVSREDSTQYWHIHAYLRSKRQAKRQFGSLEYKILSGPHELPE